VHIHNFLRDLSTYPGAFTDATGHQWKILAAKPITAQHHLQPGAMETDNKTYLHIACTDGFISVLSIQAEGKKRMEIGEFLRGNRIG